MLRNTHSHTPHPQYRQHIHKTCSLICIQGPETPERCCACAESLRAKPHIACTHLTAAAVAACACQHPIRIFSGPLCDTERARRVPTFPRSRSARRTRARMLQKWFVIKRSLTHMRARIFQQMSSHAHINAHKHTDHTRAPLALCMCVCV